MSIKSRTIAAVLALSAFAVNAQASQSWTVTTTGHIVSGYDTTGIFGTVGLDLAGLSYTQSITASTDATQWNNSDIGNYYQNMSGEGPNFTDTVTINGRTVTFSASTRWGEQLIANDISQGRPNGDTDKISSYQYGYMSNGDYLRAFNLAYSDATAFVPTLNFAQAIAKNTRNPLFSTSTDFAISGTQTAQFQGYVEFIAVNAVPEPETYGMLLAGLGLLGFVARRKAGKAA